MSDFFAAHPELFTTSQTGTHPNRLAARHRAIIGENLELLRDRRVLDMASHDGRWSLAAIEAGARHVHGIEGRPELVEKAGSIMETYGIAPDRYRFEVGDVHERLAHVEAGSIDTILCLGFFYHTVHHQALIQQFRRIGASAVIVDTVVWPARSSATFKTPHLKEWIADTGDDCIIRIGVENPEIEQNAINPAGSAPVVVGYPTVGAINLMFRNQGYATRYVDWHHGLTSDWTALLDYGLKERVTVVATDMGAGPRG